MSRTLLVSSLVAAAAVAASAGHAEISVGRIQAIDPVGHAVVLQDGTRYHLTTTDTRDWLPGFRPGDSVRLVWAAQGARRDLQEIASTRALQTIGTIAAIDPAQQRVTLRDGRSFVFYDTAETRDLLQGFSAGDTVRIGFDPGSGKLRGLSMGGTEMSQTTGIIAALDPASGLLTLADGRSFRVLTSSGEPGASLSGFRVGDAVRLTLQPAEPGRTAVAIASAEM